MPHTEMVAPASRKHIRTDESKLREVTAKQLVEKLLLATGFEIADRRLVRNRYFLDVRDPKKNKRTLWFKLGWNPGEHGTSAVQIQMIKPRAGEHAPSKWSDA